jgi:hypothetical protein
MYDEARSRKRSGPFGFPLLIDEPATTSCGILRKPRVLFHAPSICRPPFPRPNVHRKRQDGERAEALGRKRLLSWFKQFETYHYAEWNSATYLRSI